MAVAGRLVGRIGGHGWVVLWAGRMGRDGGLHRLYPRTHVAVRAQSGCVHGISRSPLVFDHDVPVVSHNKIGRIKLRSVRGGNAILGRDFVGFACL